MTKERADERSVLMVLFEPGGFPPDIRVEKEISALIGAGWSVQVLTFNTGSQPVREELCSGVTVVRIARPEWNALRRAVYFLFPRSPRLAKELTRTVRQVGPAVLHVHDLTYAGIVARVARRERIPFVLDLHENMPAAFVVYRKGWSPMKRAVSAIVHNRLLWKAFEQRIAKRAAAVLVVVDEACERFRRIRRVIEKTVVVGNTENLDTFPEGRSFNDPMPSGATTNTSSARRENLRLLYLGGIMPHRGIDTVLDGLSRMAGDENQPVTLRIVGLQDWQVEPMQRRVGSLRINDKVELVTWVPKDRVAEEIRNADLCLVPHIWAEHTNTTVPHKLYQYMMLAKPVLVSSCLPLRRIVESHSAGLVFRADDPHDFAAAIEKAVSGSVDLRELGLNGREAALGALSWNHDAKRLVHTYERIHLN